MDAASMEYSELLEGLPSGAWVAISEGKDKFVAYGAELTAVMAEARKGGEPDPLIVRVPELAVAVFL